MAAAAAEGGAVRTGKIDCLECGNQMKDVPGKLDGLSCGWCKSPRIKRRLEVYAYELSIMLQTFLFGTFIAAWALVKLVDAIADMLAR